MLLHHVKPKLLKRNKKVKLTIVVPMYNISSLLKECLDSLLKQGNILMDSKIFLIDDGSKDDTVEIAREYVENYPNLFELFMFKNAGLGAARNRGTKLANSEYITYVDSDDIVPDKIYEDMIEKITITGSDIVTGQVLRFNKNKEWKSNIHFKAIAQDLDHVNLSEHPELIWDSTSWNKVYRLDFLVKNSLYFPEKMLYEDFPMVNPAFALANGIDVLSKPVYKWRVRTNSITNSSTGASATLDRIKANQLAIQGIKKAKNSDDALKVLMKKSLDFGILAMLKKEHFNLIPNEGKKEIFNKLKEYLLMIPIDIIKDISIKNALYYLTILKINNEHEFNEFTLKFLQNTYDISGIWKNDVYVLKNDELKLYKIPTIDDFRVIQKVEKVIFENNNLFVFGYFIVENSDMSTLENISDISTLLYDENNNLVKSDVGVVNFIKRDGLSDKFIKNNKKNSINYDYSGYKISINLSNISFSENTAFKIKLKFKINNVVVSEFIKKPVPGINPRPDSNIVNGNVWGVTYNKNSDWILNLNLLDQNIPHITRDINNKLTLHNISNLYILNNKKKIPITIVNGSIFFSRITHQQLLSYSANKRGKYGIFTSINGLERKIYYDSDMISIHNNGNNILFGDFSNQATIFVSSNYPIIHDIYIENEKLIIEFNLYGFQNTAKNVEIVADYSLPDIIWETEKINKNTYRATIPLTLDGFGEKKWLNFRIRLTFRGEYQTIQVLRWGNKKSYLKNNSVFFNGIEWYFLAKKNYEGKAFVIRRSTDRSYWEKDGQFDIFIKNKYKYWLDEPLLSDHVMMSSFWGRNNTFNDNPRALYDYIAKNNKNVTTIIVIKEVLRSYPEFKNAKVIAYNTIEYWYYLAHAKYFVNNVNFTELDRVKRSDQIEVQTMHGTPLKSLGFDVLSDWSDSNYLDLLKKNNNWDYLVTPSDWVTEYAIKAFNVSPKIINSGYPRNDRLFQNVDVDKLKDKFGISKGKKIIGYTPTWREKKDTDINKYFDIEKFYSIIPNDCLVILKNHHYEKWMGIPNKFNDKIIYAPDNMDIDDIYIISDVLITDYSSVMFDFILLNKPIIFFAFDYTEYNENRGLNFNLMDEAPGPFISRLSELEYELLNLESNIIRYEENITNFKNKFVQYDDGHAASKIISKLFEN